MSELVLFADCKHEDCVPPYDKELCKDKDAAWIRKHFPRFFGKCPTCHQQVIVYNCFEQYVMGDY